MGRKERPRSANGLIYGEGLVGQCAMDKQKILLDNRAPRLHPHLVWTGVGPTTQRARPAPRLRGPGPGRSRTGIARAASTRPTRRSSINSPNRSASCSTPSKPTCGPRTCSSNRSRWPRSSRTASRSCSKPTRNWRRRRRLAHQNQEVERKNSEVEQARLPLLKRAEQLALTTKYKSEFLANMSPRIADSAQQFAHSLGSALEEPRRKLDRQADRSSRGRSTRPATIC